MKQFERDAIGRQREAKWMKKEVLRNKKVMAAQNEYAIVLTYIETLSLTGLLETRIGHCTSISKTKK